jgi:hypothetical protein
MPSKNSQNFSRAQKDITQVRKFQKNIRKDMEKHTARKKQEALVMQ